MVGSGAWACAAARMVAQNTVATPGGVFQDMVPMWVYEETVEVSGDGSEADLKRARASNKLKGHIV